MNTEIAQCALKHRSTAESREQHTFEAISHSDTPSEHCLFVECSYHMTMHVMRTNGTAMNTAFLCGVQLS